MKRYLCKDCNNNNNGFCKINRTGGLKQNNIQYCKFYKIRKCFSFKSMKIVKIYRIKK